MKDETGRPISAADSRSGTCPVCGRPAHACEACEGGLEGRLALEEALRSLRGLPVPEPSPQAMEDTLLACRAALPFVLERRRAAFRFRLVVAAAVLLVALTALLAFLPLGKEREAPLSLRMASVTVEEAAARIERSFGRTVVVSDSARRRAWLERASFFLRAPDAARAARAVADAFGLACVEWGDDLVILDRETALRERGSVIRVTMDLSLSLTPEQAAKLEHVGSELLAVSGPRFSAEVAEKVRVPYIFEPDRDVPLVNRKDDLFTVSRELPFFRIGRDMKLEFLALAPEDLRRFEALRVLARGGRFHDPARGDALGPLADPLPAGISGRTTVGAVLEALSAHFDVAVGPGVDVSLPASRSLRDAGTVGEALHRLCAGRPFYFTWLPREKVLLLDDRAALQRWLYTALYPLPKGLSGAQAVLRLRTELGSYFPFDRERTGDFAVSFGGALLVRAHVYPLYVLSRSGFFSPER